MSPSSLVSRLFSCRAASALRPLRALPGRRMYSSKPGAESGPSHTDFYKTFGRPIAKVLMIAMFTYQVLYIGWTKMEHDEIRAHRSAEVSALEKKVEELRTDKK